MTLNGKLSSQAQSPRPAHRSVVVSPPQQRELIDDDQALVRRLLAREENAWIEFVTQYDRLVRSRILAACRETGRLTVQADLAAEIGAEVYAALVDNEMKVLRSYSGRSRLSTWLSVIVRRFTLRHIARLNQLALGGGLEQCPHVPNADGIDRVRQERLQAVARARLRLSTTDQLLLRLFYDESRSYKEIASRLTISVNAVGPKLDRARQRLRKMVEGDT